jgi:hypothetical protein
MSLSLYLITDPDAIGYDTWDSWVVAAKSKRRALRMAPNGNPDSMDGPWAVHAKAQFIGTARVTIHEPEVICASYNAG